VVATTPEGTTSALRAAQRLAAGLNARITILVPHVVSYVVPLDHPTEDPTALIDRYRQLASKLGVDAGVRLCLCRTPGDVFRKMLCAGSVVVVGGRRGTWFRRTREERLKRELIRQGHEVVFVDVHADEHHVR
jgi:hypothetical protein